MSDWYTHSTYPSTGSTATSASMRAELDAISAAFAKLPAFTGNASKILIVNALQTAVDVSTPDAIGVVDKTTAQTLTNKSLDLASNTLTGTTAQFNAALSDDDFATLTNSVVLTNKSISLATNTVTGTTAQFNSALSDDDFATLTNTVNLTNKTLTLPTIIGINEPTSIVASPATGTINFDASSYDVVSYTSNATGNWTLNVRGNGGATLDSTMAIGQTRSISFEATQGATPYYQTAMTIDGGAVTPKWTSKTAPTSGNASGIDTYTFAITKTGSATFLVRASRTQFG